MCWLYMQLSWRRGRCLLLDYLSRLNLFIKPINIQMNVCLQMIHWLFEPLIFSFDDIFKEKRQSLILHFSLLHVIALLVAVVFGSGDHKIFMWCIVWGWMNNLKVESMLWQTDWLFLGFILNYFSRQWDHRRSPFWSLKLYFIRPRFLENEQIPSLAIGPLRKELALKNFDSFWVVYRLFGNRITRLLIASLSPNLFLFHWCSGWRGFIVHHECRFILMRFNGSQRIHKVIDTLGLASPYCCDSAIVGCTVAVLLKLMKLVESHETI